MFKVLEFDFNCEEVNRWDKEQYDYVTVSLKARNESGKAVRRVEFIFLAGRCTNAYNSGFADVYDSAYVKYEHGNGRSIAPSEEIIIHQPIYASDDAASPQEFFHFRGLTLEKIRVFYTDGTQEIIEVPNKITEERKKRERKQRREDRIYTVLTILKYLFFASPLIFYILMKIEEKTYFFSNVYEFFENLIDTIYGYL